MDGWEISIPYTPDQIEQVAEAMDEWLDREDQLLGELMMFQFKNPIAEEFMRHGLARRLRLIRHCAERIFQTIPMDVASPTPEDRQDATAYLHTFVINVFGAIDNMAHIWCNEAVVKHRGNDIPRRWIGLTPQNEIVRNSLSKRFRDYLATLDDWFKYLENYRHALAHRIPLYIPPSVLDEEAQAEYARFQAEMDVALSADMERYWELFGQQQRVGRFEPLMQHSFGEQAQPMRFHPQIVCDFSTTVEIGEHLLGELRL